MISPKEIYHQEAEELLSDIEETILDLEKNPHDTGCIDRLFRSIHTIKGSGAMFGFDGISDFSHYIETVLDYVRDGKLQVSSQLIDLILASRDHIKSMLNPGENFILTEKERSIRLINSIQSILPGDLKLNELRSGAFKLDTEKNDKDDNHKNESFHDLSSSSETRKGQTFRILFRPGSDTFINGTDPFLLLDELRNMGHCIITALTGDIPLLETIDADKCYIAWEIFLVTRYTKNDVYDVFIFIREDSRIIIENITPGDTADNLVPRLGDILISRGDASPQDVNEILDQYQEKIGESFIKSGIVTPSTINSALIEQKILTKEAGKKGGTGSLRVSSNKLDNLINLVGELVITQARISQLTKQADDLEDIEPEKIAENLGLLMAKLANPIEILERLTADLRDCALDMRMIPIGTIFGKFRRLVRDLSAELGKDIELELYGAETQLDKTVIERLNDPLMHLIRNSIDHGIRTPDTREKYGKKRKGKIKLTAAHQGPHVAITIEDDGMGLDLEAIRKRALEKGLIKENTELSKKQIFSLVFLPGFSTARKLTNISGRGVGLDVVKQEIDSLGGTIRIKSTRGKSTCITMLLPLTLAIIEGLLMDAGGDYFVLPLSQVEECMEINKEFIDTGNGRNMVVIREELIPFIRLKEIFEISCQKKQLPDEYLPDENLPDEHLPDEHLPDEHLIDEHLAVARADSFRIGIVADRIIGNIQTVIKSMDKRYQNAEGISGAAILGDGSVALIIDIPGLIRCAIKEEINIMH